MTGIDQNLHTSNLSQPLRVLVVCSGNAHGDRPFNFERDKAFTYEQVLSLKQLGVEVDVFFIRGKGVNGYLKNLGALHRRLARDDFDVVHAHFTTSGIFARLQLKKPLVVTFHGCDINEPHLRFLSQGLMLTTSFNIFVEPSMLDKVKAPGNSQVIPCGVDLNLFRPLDQQEARREIGVGKEEKLVLFASSFDREEKNPALAKQAVAILGDDVRLMELSNMNRDEVVCAVNAADVMLMTSDREGSPQIVKEAMACNVPIVSTDVGDVRAQVGDTKGCFITSHEPEDVADGLRAAFSFGGRTKGRVRMQRFELAAIAAQVAQVYEKVTGWKDHSEAGAVPSTTVVS